VIDDNYVLIIRQDYMIKISLKLNAMHVPNNYTPYNIYTTLVTTCIIIKFQSSYLVYRFWHRDYNSKQTQYSRNMHRPFIWQQSTTVACCYHVDRGETGDPWSGKKQRHGHLWLDGISHGHHPGN